LSIYENIRFGKINATRAEIEEAAQQANAHSFIMQLPDVCHKYLFIFIYKYVRLFTV
jgi:ABC-type multidrug transport system fused ATPase/permease subunit